MPTLHFTLGEDLGIQLAEIAKEHIHEMDLEKAVDTFSGSFGCSTEMAKRLITGELVVTVDDPEKCMIGVCKREELDADRQKQYPQVTCDEVFKIIEKNFQDAIDYEEGYVFEHMRLEMSTVNRLLSINDDLFIDAELSSMFFELFPDWFPKGVAITGNISILPRVILKDILDHHGSPSKFEEFIDDAVTYNISKYGDGYKMYRIIYLVKSMVNILKHEKQIMALEDFCIEQFKCDNYHKYATERYFETIKELMGRWLRLIQYTNSKMSEFDESKEDSKRLTEYLESL